MSQETSTSRCAGTQQQDRNTAAAHHDPQPCVLHTAQDTPTHTWYNLSKHPSRARKRLGHTKRHHRTDNPAPSKIFPGDEVPYARRPAACQQNIKTHLSYKHRRESPSQHPSVNVR